jgi:probable rRNA maturation factor
MKPRGELAVDVSSTLRRRVVSLERARNVALLALQSEHVRNAMISIVFVSAPRIATLNSRYLKKNRPTDVIAFGFGSASRGGAVVGDIYICPDVAKTNAKAERVSLREELDRLVVHGILHVLGYDHPESASRTASKMWRRQETILKRAVR